MLSHRDIRDMATRFQNLCGLSDQESEQCAVQLAAQLSEQPEIAKLFKGCAWEAVDREIEDWDHWAREAAKDRK